MQQTTLCEERFIKQTACINKGKMWRCTLVAQWWQWNYMIHPSIDTA